MTRTQLLAAILVLVSALASTARVAAQDVNVEETPVLLVADEVVYDESLGIVTARGNVELSQGPRVLLADIVSYNRKADTVIASGNVSLMEPSGEVLFSDYVELNDKLKTGTINNFRGLLVDGSRLAAVQGRRTGGQRKELDKAVFSPCDLCKEDPTKAPLWQIKAVKVIHDEVAKDIIYEDATLEFYGFPVAYTPFLRHPDPTVDRRSGLLAPTMGISEELGVIYGQPYYYVIDETSDLVVEPRMHSTAGGILLTDYRKRFSRGELDMKTSLAYVEQSTDERESDEFDFEGHADWEGKFSLNPTWRAGFDFEQASQRTYLRRYNIGGPDVLTSRLYAEGFRGRNYTSVAAYKFQDLRGSSDPDDTPIVLPLAEYSHVGQPGRFGGRTSLDASLLALTRDSGGDTRRASAVTGWELPFTSDAGEIYTLNARLQTDAYYATDASALSNGDTETTGRAFPQLGLKWQYPLGRRSGTTTQVIEPIAGLVLGPRGGNPDEIPNEDSRSFEFDETNLFRLNRYEGVDRVTSGSHVNYGLRAGVYGDGGGSTEILVGQSYRFYGDGSFEEGSGLEEDLSDVVGALSVRPTGGPLTFTYRFRLDPEDATLNRNEVGFNFSQPRFYFGGNYVTLADNASSDLTGDREQLDLYGGVTLTDHWRIASNLTHDLSQGRSRLLRGRFGFTYVDECTLFGIDFERSNISDEDIEPDDRVMFRLILTHLGGLESK
ncbi:LPS-assembly protein LptD [Thalassobaculum litoreum]|uniref:LPS-assembly protein LptD n=1 Tax=Thalassobaculum litoreum DSM 18839 TaxID=1123362 RepID=A0A8G2ETW9_9PROT|nr:LPS assembly protein LptD [Thalassobaculum litoreum]SDF05929.1 LPS-assembly protein [Thalassobaculum litoreum DSM 18839]